MLFRSEAKYERMKLKNINVTTFEKLSDLNVGSLTDTTLCIDEFFMKSINPKDLKRINAKSLWIVIRETYTTQEAMHMKLDCHLSLLVLQHCMEDRAPALRGGDGDHCHAPQERPVALHMSIARKLSNTIRRKPPHSRGNRRCEMAFVGFRVRYYMQKGGWCATRAH